MAFGGNDDRRRHAAGQNETAMSSSGGEYCANVRLTASYNRPTQHIWHIYNMREIDYQRCSSSPNKPCTQRKNASFWTYQPNINLVQPIINLAASFLCFPLINMIETLPNNLTRRAANIVHLTYYPTTVVSKYPVMLSTMKCC